MDLYKIDLDSNDGLDIQNIRPFVIFNTIAIADNITFDIISNKNEIKETEIYEAIDKYLKDSKIMEMIYEDCYVILDDNNIDIYEME